MDERKKEQKVQEFFEEAADRHGKEQMGQTEDFAAKSEELVKRIIKGRRKSTLAWAYQTALPVVHKKNGEEASEDYLRAILFCYSSMKTYGINREAAFLAGGLAEDELAGFVEELLNRWLEMELDAKKRYILYVASIHGGACMVERFRHLIQEWSKLKKRAFAAEAVRALALSPEPQAILIVDEMARKGRFRQIKKAAAQALEYAAEQFGLTYEELLDRSVPNFGFDEKGERIFNYGKRRFLARITSECKLEVLDENGKRYKNLPAPHEKDEEETAAYSEWKQLKKQMQMTYRAWKKRMELEIFSWRKWKTEGWKNLFVKNPLLHDFAIGVIWGVYQEGKLVQSFRYLEDGSFTTSKEEEYRLPEDGRIGIVHPVELSSGVLQEWREQMQDYEIEQPIDQMEREIFLPKKEEMTLKKTEQLQGKKMAWFRLQKQLSDLGWGYDELICSIYFREDAAYGMGAELRVDGHVLEDAKICDVRFYPIGVIDRDGEVFDEIDEGRALAIGEVNPRYFSEVLRQISLIVG